MKAMILAQPGLPLTLEDLPIPTPGPGQLLLRVLACGVCRTDLHVYDGDLHSPRLPLVMGHEIVGRVEALGENVAGFALGERVGVPWLGSTDGTCAYCRGGQENLCEKAGFTGYTLDGGYAEYTVASQRYCFRIPTSYRDANAAPLLCAGLIGYRSYRMAGKNAEHVGFYGFGAAAHIITQLAVQQGRRVYAFTRPGDRRRQEFARSLGAVWAGGSDERPPQALDAAILFAPLGALLPLALAAVDKGGRVVCAGIHMSDIPAFPYRLLWEERQVISVANLTRQDGVEFMQVIAAHPVHTRVKTYPLEKANRALSDLRAGAFEGAAVLIP
ncbi:MAG TPA: zinc-dependent alcohol dehydrogenase family protein [Levilinea sp.]|nr:zinc-dependent alcohol dehydrogenase family protein [Levilinea sp.]